VRVRVRRDSVQHPVIAAVAVAVCLFLLTSATKAVIEPLVDIDHGGMFGLRLGDTATRVRDVLGRPDDVTRLGSEVHWFYARFGLQMFIDLRSKRVTDLFTSDARAKTATGVGVGSTEQEIVSAYPDALCRHGPDPHGQSCNVGGERSVTSFDLAAGRVEFIDIEPAHPLPQPLDPIIDVFAGSIFRIALGQSQTHVRAMLGQPDTVFQDRPDRQIGWSYSSRLDLTVYFGRQYKRVAFLDTQDPRVKTSGGLGLGSTEPQITQMYPGTTCGTYKGKGYCNVGGHNVVTTFTFEHGHVYDITISRP
jgi:hypothetical protein